MKTSQSKLQTESEDIFNLLQKIVENDSKNTNLRKKMSEICKKNSVSQIEKSKIFHEMKNLSSTLKYFVEEYEKFNKIQEIIISELQNCLPGEEN